MIMIKEETQDTRLQQNFGEGKKGNPTNEQIKPRGVGGEMGERMR